jgi:hypothetical protein
VTLGVGTLHLEEGACTGLVRAVQILLLLGALGVLVWAFEGARRGRHLPGAWSWDAAWQAAAGFAASFLLVEVLWVGLDGPLVAFGPLIGWVLAAAPLRVVAPLSVRARRPAPVRATGWRRGMVGLAQAGLALLWLGWIFVKAPPAALAGRVAYRMPLAGSAMGFLAPFLFALLLAFLAGRWVLERAARHAESK